MRLRTHVPSSKKSVSWAVTVVDSTTPQSWSTVYDADHRLWTGVPDAATDAGITAAAASMAAARTRRVIRWFIARSSRWSDGRSAIGNSLRATWTVHIGTV